MITMDAIREAVTVAANTALLTDKIKAAMDGFDSSVRANALAWLVAEMTHEYALDAEDAKVGLSAFAADVQEFMDSLFDENADEALD